MRRERRHTRRGARAGKGGPEAVAAEPEKAPPLWNAVLARYELAHGPEENRWNSDPAGATGLRDDLRDAPALPWLVEVAPGEALDLAETHPRRVEDEQR